MAANGSAVGRILHFYACTGDVGNICTPGQPEGAVLHSLISCFIMFDLHAFARFVWLGFMLCFIYKLFVVTRSSIFHEAPNDIGCDRAAKRSTRDIMSNAAALTTGMHFEGGSWFP